MSGCSRPVRGLVLEFSQDLWVGLLNLTCFNLSIESVLVSGLSLTISGAVSGRDHIWACFGADQTVSGNCFWSCFRLFWGSPQFRALPIVHFLAVWGQTFLDLFILGLLETWLNFGAGTWKQGQVVYMKTMGKHTCMSTCARVYKFYYVLRVQGF